MIFNNSAQQSWSNEPLLDIYTESIYLKLTQQAH